MKTLATLISHNLICKCRKNLSSLGLDSSYLRIGIDFRSGHHKIFYHLMWKRPVENLFHFKNLILQFCVLDSFHHLSSRFLHKQYHLDLKISKGLDQQEIFSFCLLLLLNLLSNFATNHPKNQMCWDQLFKPFIHFQYYLLPFFLNLQVNL